MILKLLGRSVYSRCPRMVWGNLFGQKVDGTFELRFCDLLGFGVKLQ